MTAKTRFMSMTPTEISVVSTIDEHGEPVDVTVMGSPAAVRQALEDTRAGGWARFFTPEGVRIYLHPRFAARVDSAGRFSRAA